MDLKLRKKINNVERFQYGTNGQDYQVGQLNQNTFYGNAGLGNMQVGRYNLPDATQYWDRQQHPINTIAGTNITNPFLQQSVLSMINSQVITGTGLFSGYGDKSSGASSQAIGGAVQGGVLAVQTGLSMAASNAEANAQVRDENELQQVAGTRQVNGSGYSYTALNNIDRNAEFKRMRDINNRLMLAQTAIGVGGGAAVGAGVGALFGSAAGPIGSGIGAAVGLTAGLLFGEIGAKHRMNKLRKRVFNAQQLIDRNNAYYASSAQSDYLGSLYGLNYLNTQDDAMFTANHGKDLRQPKYE